MKLGQTYSKFMTKEEDEVVRRIEEAFRQGEYRLCACLVCWSWEPTSTRRADGNVGVFCYDCWPTFDSVAERIDNTK